MSHFNWEMSNGCDGWYPSRLTSPVTFLTPQSKPDPDSPNQGIKSVPVAEDDFSPDEISLLALGCSLKIGAMLIFLAFVFINSE